MSLDKLLYLFEDDSLFFYEKQIDSLLKGISFIYEYPHFDMIKGLNYLSHFDENEDVDFLTSKIKENKCAVINEFNLKWSIDRQSPEFLNTFRRIFLFDDDFFEISIISGNFIEKIDSIQLKNLKTENLSFSKDFNFMKNFIKNKKFEISLKLLKKSKSRKTLEDYLNQDSDSKAKIVINRIKNSCINKRHNNPAELSLPFAKNIFDFLKINTTFDVKNFEELSVSDFFNEDCTKISSLCVMESLYKNRILGRTSNGFDIMKEIKTWNSEHIKFFEQNLEERLFISREEYD